MSEGQKSGGKDPMWRRMIDAVSIPHQINPEDPSRDEEILTATNTGGPSEERVNMTIDPPVGPEPKIYATDPTQTNRLRKASGYDSSRGTIDDYEKLQAELDKLNSQTPDPTIQYELNPTPSPEDTRLGVARERWRELVRDIKSKSSGGVTLGNEGQLILVKGVLYGDTIGALSAYSDQFAPLLAEARQIMRENPDLFPIK